ncbi:hypothetical protein GP486_003700 [Trichoglossum hirsutum]|uniref:LIM zinc-binding domain-containing protein n=1 Tax=Trichoglossum hirsutum TaxID=265104 RepID=A0A9P8RQB5_9PEZI|nr:hypothetical protein GP486_003700 [Trichoglossum hirsutum]
MGDHLCSTVPESARLPEPSAQLKATPPGARANDFGSSIDLLKPGRMASGRTAPPRIDPQVANRPFIRQDQLTPISNPSDSHNVSPVTPDDGRAPSQAPFRGMAATLPGSLRPPTPELESNLDCAFPPFPMRAPRTAPTESRGEGERNRMGQMYAEPSPLYAPPTPKTTGSGSVFQRMNMIAPGPFGVRSRNSGIDQPEETSQSLGHQRTPSSKDGLTPSSWSGPRSHAQRPSTAGSERSQRRLGFDGSEFNKKGFPDQLAAFPWSGKQEVHINEAGPPLPEKDSPGVGRDGLRPENRSRTFPLENRSKPLPRRPTDQSHDPFNRGPPTPNSLGNNGYGDGSHAPWGRESARLMDRQDIVHHTPTVSRSSNGSGSGSDARTASSRSSPPASETHRKSRRKPSDTSNIDGLMRELQASMKPPQPTDVVTKEPEVQLRRSPEILDSSRDSKTNGEIVAPTAPKDTAPKEVNNRSPNRRPATAKGNCRGCGELIKGKSVSSADGRLTGRYHKRCFVCKTCREPFETATFYVLQNNPFCERHYHQLNNSLCHACDQGIEGQYLETERKQKYHKNAKGFSATTTMSITGWLIASATLLDLHSNLLS